MTVALQVLLVLCGIGSLDFFRFVILPFFASSNFTCVSFAFYSCIKLHDKNTLCGKCKDGYGIALYSYTLECSKCWVLSGGDLPHKSYLLSTDALVFMSQIVVYTV